MKIVIKSGNKSIAIAVNPVTFPIETTGDYGAISVEGDTEAFKDVFKFLFMLPGLDGNSIGHGVGTFNDLTHILGKLKVPYSVENPLPQKENDRKIKLEFKNLFIP